MSLTVGVGSAVGVLVGVCVAVADAVGVFVGVFVGVCVAVAVVFAVAFVAFNIGYLWVRKDDQFVERAAPTAEMLNVLRNKSPQRVLILDFPYPNGEIAKASVATLPGWDHDSIVIGSSVSDCPECLRLSWDPQLKSYHENRP